MKRLNLNDFDKWSDVKRSDRSEAKKLIGEFLVDKINQYLDQSSSPVSGGSYKRVKADKKPSKLSEEGDMRSQITWSEQGSKVAVGIFKDAPEVEKLKSYNHNVGVTLPQRQFIPQPDQKFKRQINTGIKRIIESFLDGEV